VNTPPTIILTGPTATGKTDLSLQIARHFNTPIISADARQCYKYLDIGTAKAPPSVLEEIPHYFISVLDPDVTATASGFADRVRQWKRDIQKQGKPVLIVGGSTLYIESLIRPLDQIPPKNDSNIRELETIAEKSGLEEIRRRLESVDPEYARRIDGPNPHRMFRALDVWMQTGKPFSSFHRNRDLTVPADTVVFCLNRDRHELHDRINRRVDQMIQEGLLDEVKSILDMGYEPSLQSLQTVGYRESIAHLQGKISAGELREQIKTATRRYARRQLTWFRRWKGVTWINQSDLDSKKTSDIVRTVTEQLAAKA